MFPIMQKSLVQEEIVHQTDNENDKFYFEDGCMYKKLTIYRLLRNKGADSKIKLNLIVTKIIKEDHQVAFSYLLQNNYKMNVLNDKYQTAVHLAFYNNCRSIQFLLGLYLLNTHDNSNCCDSNGLTYLHVACYMDNVPVAEKFLSDGMDINLPLYLDFQGYKTDLTLLHFAVTQSSIDVIRLLLEYGASVEAVDAVGRTPLHLACSVYEFSQKYYGINVEIMKILLESKSNVNAKDNNNNTLLMSMFPDDYYEFQVFKATRFFDVMVVVETLKKFKLLVQQGIDLNASNSNGDTVLHFVIRNMRHLQCPSNHPIVSFADTAHLEMVELILSSNQKVNIDAQNNTGETPIEVAVASMSTNIVEMLLKYGVDLRNLKFNYKIPIWFYHPLFVPNLKSIQHVICMIELLKSHGFEMTVQDNFAILKFFIHDFDECECGSIHDLPNSCDKRVYLVHLLQYGSPKHIKHVLKKALHKLSTTIEEELMDWIYILIGEYLRCVKMGDLYVDEEVMNIIKDFDISHAPMYSLKDMETEVDRMKCIKLKDNVTLYDIMVEDPHDICELIKSNVNVYSISKNFSCYKDIIEGHIAKALVRIYVVNSACRYLKELVQPSLLYHCCQIIVNYLSNEDILAMHEAIAT